MTGRLHQCDRGVLFYCDNKPDMKIQIFESQYRCGEYQYPNIEYYTIYLFIPCSIQRIPRSIYYEQ
jgi:hypothetical protein